jgi:8-oxo-dGTP pyrophosphatase MutT (NUDIX family)
MRRQTIQEQQEAPASTMNYIGSNRLIRRVRQLFGGEPLPLQVAALPWRRTKNGIEVMLITSRAGGRWLLPKGWPELGEEFCDAAAREAHEEAGLSGAVSSAMAGRYFYEKSAGGNGMRFEVMVYALEVGNVAGKWKEKRERRRKWVAPAKAANLVAEPELAQLILDFAAEAERATA